MEPKFTIGFELEGLVREGNQGAFDTGLANINCNIDRGTDSSVDGMFSTKVKDSRGSFLTQDEGNGIEIRTPPLPLASGIRLFEQILSFLEKWTEAKNFKTNSTCGLHVNLSEAHMVSDLKRYKRWYAHLVSMFPERKILEMFRRTKNTYCKPLFARGDSREVQDILSRIECMEGFGTHKYHSVGIHHLNPYVEDELRRLEFRCLGGTNYHLKHAELQTSIDTIIETATEAFQHVVSPSKESAEDEQLSRDLARGQYNIPQAVGVY